MPGAAMWGLAATIAIGASYGPADPVIGCCRGTGKALEEAVPEPGVPVKGPKLEPRRPKPGKQPGWRRATDLHLLRLLVVIAWADGEIQASEADRVFELAHGVDRQMSRDARLAAAMERRESADEPDFSVLVAQRPRVLWEVDMLIRIDGKRAPEENEARMAVLAALDRAARSRPVGANPR